MERYPGSEEEGSYRQQHNSKVGVTKKSSGRLRTNCREIMLVSPMPVTTQLLAKFVLGNKLNSYCLTCANTAATATGSILQDQKAVGRVPLVCKLITHSYYSLATLCVCVCVVCVMALQMVNSSTPKARPRKSTAIRSNEQLICLYHHLLLFFCLLSQIPASQTATIPWRWRK